MDPLTARKVQPGKILPRNGGGREGSSYKEGGSDSVTPGASVGIEKLGTRQTGGEIFQGDWKTKKGEVRISVAEPEPAGAGTFWPEPAPAPP